MISVALAALLGCSVRPAETRDRDPRTLLTALMQAWNRHDTGAIDSLMAPGTLHEDLALGMRAEGLDSIKGFMRQTYKTIPDFEWKPTDVLVDGSKAASEWTLAGTYTGDTPSGPVKGRRFSIRGASVVKTEHGRITRFSDYYTLDDFWRQVAK
jgi:steroid delta-isomerase-like uncharacterized protein